MAVKVDKTVNQTCAFGHKTSPKSDAENLLKGGRCPTCGHTFAEFIEMGKAQARSGAAGPFERE